MADPQAVKPRLLVSWGNPYVLDHCLALALPKLAQSFDIYLLLVDYNLAEGARAKVQEWIDARIIVKLWVCPGHGGSLATHRFMHALLPALTDCAFDAYLSISDVQPYERYITDCALPDKCARVLLWPHPANLALYPEVAAAAWKFDGTRMLRACDGIRKKLQPSIAVELLRPTPESWRILAALAWVGVRKFLKPAPYRPWAMVRRAWPMLKPLDLETLFVNYYQTLDRVLLPAMAVGRGFWFRRFDYLTQIGSGGYRRVLFYDAKDARDHELLYGPGSCSVVRYPVRVAEPAERLPLILMPFTLHGPENMGPDLVRYYVRDLAIAMRATGAQGVHLRPHPGRNDSWLQNLADVITSWGVPCKLVDARLPIAEAAAPYLGVVGAASGALREARLACPHLFVVGSMALSKAHFPDPRGLIGLADSIGWIEEDGSYDPEIFTPRAAAEDGAPALEDELLRLAGLTLEA